jgi:hypothetical protein
MANLLRIEPSKWCEGEAWYVFDDGKQYLRKIPSAEPEARSSFPCPAIRKDGIDPIRSMADGKMYDSLSGLYKSYRADGNPQGVNYNVIGDDVSTCTTFKPKERDEKKAHEAIERTLQEFGI